MNTITTDRLVPVAEVAKRLGVLAQAIERGAYGVTVFRDWSGRPVISEADAVQIREQIKATARANWERKREAEARRARENEIFEDDRERRFYTAYAAVLEKDGAYGHLHAPAAAYNVLAAKDPEDALRRVVKQYGQPDERTIMRVMGQKKGRPRWVK